MKIWQHQQLALPTGLGETISVDTWIGPAHDRASLKHALDEVLSPDEVIRSARFARNEDRNRYITARGLVRTHLAERLGVPPQFAVYDESKPGKPSLHAQFAASGLRFSWSHAAGAVLVAIAAHVEVGADIEPLTSLERVQTIPDEFLTQADRDDIAAHGDINAALRVWTRKEAALKAVGVGLDVPMTAFDSTPISDAHVVLSIPIDAASQPGAAARVASMRVPMLTPETANYLADVAIHLPTTP